MGCECGLRSEDGRASKVRRARKASAVGQDLATAVVVSQYVIDWQVQLGG